MTSESVEDGKPNPNRATYWFNIERIEKLETALRDIRALHHQPNDSESKPGAIHRAVVVGICDAALEAK